MNFKHLQTFVTICESGTVSRAAGQLRITQPALSRRIKALQEELGVRLFDNLGRRLSLTSEGEEFVRHSRALLAQAEAVLATGRAWPRPSRRLASRRSSAHACGLLPVLCE